MERTIFFIIKKVCIKIDSMYRTPLYLFAG